MSDAAPPSAPPPPPPPPSAPTAPTARTDVAVSLRSVSRWYGDVVAVNDVSFDLGPGVTGLLGPNGAGKSTLLHLMAGLLRPSSGDLRVLGEAPWGNVGLYTRVGLVAERESVYAFLTAWEHVLGSARLHRLPDPEAAARQAIDLVELTEAMHRPMGGYSKGMKQRAKIAAALVHDPQVLILDEPFNGTDPRQRLQMSDVLRDLGAQGRTIVFSSHILEDVEHLAQEVLVVIGGRLAASGDYRQIRRLMTNRPHAFTIRSDANRALAAHLAGRDDIAQLTFAGDALEVRTTDFGAFTLAIAPIVRELGIELRELVPADDSLEDVFEYLVGP